MNDREIMRRLLSLENEVQALRQQTLSFQSVQNPFWFGIVIADVLAAEDPVEFFTEGQAELLIPDKAGESGALKASGKALPFINRWEELSLQRGTLVLFARDWNKSIIVTPGCDPSYEDLLTLDEDGEPLPGSSS